MRRPARLDTRQLHDPGLRAADRKHRGAGLGPQDRTDQAGQADLAGRPCRGPLQIVCEIYAWDLSVRAAHLDQSHGFFNGTSVFLRAAGHEGAPCLLELAPPRGLDWKVYTSLPEADGHPRRAPRHGFGMYRAPDYDALVDHPIEMGTPRSPASRPAGPGTSWSSPATSPTWTSNGWSRTSARSARSRSPSLNPARAGRHSWTARTAMYS